MSQLSSKNSLLGLPREVRNIILGYALPPYLNTPFMTHMGNFTSSKDYYMNYDNFYPPDNCHRGCVKGECPLSIMWTNLQLHAEVLDHVYSKPVELILCEGSFFGGYASDMAESAERGEKYMFQLNSYRKEFGGFKKLKQVTVLVIPSNFPGYWPCLHSALSTLCQEELTQPLPTLTIDLKDMKHGSWWGMKEDYIEDVYEPIKARLADYSATLDFFEDVVGKANSCTIILPYWAQEHKGIHSILLKWHQFPRATISFGPIPDSRHYLAELADE